MNYSQIQWYWESKVKLTIHPGVIALQFIAIVQPTKGERTKAMGISVSTA